MPLLQDLAARRSPELRRLFADPRVELQVGDGRDDLLRADRRYDVVAVDTLRPQAAFSGNLYSTEFYQLVHDRLADDGLLAQWVPTDRTINSVLARASPTSCSSHARLPRLDVLRRRQAPIAVDPASSPAGRAAGRPGDGSGRRAAGRDLGLLPRADPGVRHDGDPVELPPDELVNRDLRPRDEYFLNQPGSVGGRPACVAPWDCTRSRSEPL